MIHGNYGPAKYVCGKFRLHCLASFKSINRLSIIRVDSLDVTNRYSDISGYFWESNYDLVLCNLKHSKYFEVSRDKNIKPNITKYNHLKFTEIIRSPRNTRGFSLKCLVYSFHTKQSVPVNIALIWSDQMIKMYSIHFVKIPAKFTLLNAIISLHCVNNQALRRLILSFGSFSYF